MIDEMSYRKVQLRLEAIKIEIDLLKLDNPADHRLDDTLRLLSEAIRHIPRSTY